MDTRHQINRVLENKKIRPMNLYMKINQKDSILESDPFDSEVRILDWILYIVCSNETIKD